MSDIHIELIEGLKRLVSIAGPSLEEAERDAVLRFVEVDEYGLALQTCADIYREGHKPIPEDVKTLMTELAKRMHIVPEELFSGANRKV